MGRTRQKTKYSNLKRKKYNKRKSYLRKIGIILLIFVIVAVVGIWVRNLIGTKQKVENLGKAEVPEWIDTQIIDIDGVSRNGTHLKKIKDIVIHYVGNPGSTAQQNRDFYNKASSSVSSHFVVGLKGEIIQCLPLDEMSAASNWRNGDTISIEVCHPDSTGKFKKKTYKALVKLTAWLEGLCDLDETHIIRHYDITGKECPRYFVQHEDKWKKFKNDVKKYREKIEKVTFFDTIFGK